MNESVEKGWLVGYVVRERGDVDGRVMAVVELRVDGVVVVWDEDDRRCERLYGFGELECVLRDGPFELN